jgi:hypothetical protein
MVLAGQSPGTLQPQVPLTQAVPFGLPWQFTHVPPPLPQAVNSVPATQTPPLQQPLWQSGLVEQHVSPCVPQVVVCEIQGGLWLGSQVWPFVQPHWHVPALSICQHPFGQLAGAIQIPPLLLPKV